MTTSKASKVLSLVGWPTKQAVRRAEWLIRNNPEAELTELARIISDDIDVALEEFV